MVTWINIKPNLKMHKRNFQKPWSTKKQPQNVSHSVNNFSHEPKHGLYGFSLYFPEEGTEQRTQAIVQNVASFQKFIKNHSELFSLADASLQKSFNVNYKFLTLEDHKLFSEWKNFKFQLVNETEFCLNCMSLAMHQCIMNDFLNKENLNGPHETLGVVRARLINYEPIQPIKAIRVNNYGKLISLRGTIIKVANLKTMYQYLAFECSTCTTVQVVKQADTVYTVPNKCTTSSCRAQSNFKPLQNSPYSYSISWQPIKIQELIGSDEFENGRVPRTLECELTEDLVNSCIPGDDIIITGVIKVRNPSEPHHKNKQNTGLPLYLDAISITNTKDQNQDNQAAPERISFNLTDYYAIQKIHSEPNLFRFLVHSLCPQIYGHELVKAGLLLALFGGYSQSHGSRAESHILLVGDPGLGKSQLLHACVNVVPRGIYVCGNTSTGSGLTVTLTREERGEYALEAGALKLADHGVCCIDEFDKMPGQHASLLEVMEQQRISIAKAGMVCSIPTKATILAAANPACGHYNKAKTISENLKISSPMLSRFDLVFILLDQANKQVDVMLSEHVLAIHSGKKSSKNMSILSKSGTKGLKGHLSLVNDEEIDYLPHGLFRKYIAYAQKYVHPEISDEAEQTLKEFYLQLRRQYRNGDTTPITSRQLNSLIRLTQARAKVELREEATKQDATDVIEIMKETLIDIFTDNVGVLDTTRSQQGTGMSSKNQIMKLLRHMQQTAESQSHAIFTTNEIKEMSSEVGIAPNKFYSLLQSLNIQGFILYKGANKYQLVSAEL